MSLNNTQYDKIMKVYEDRRLSRQRLIAANRSKLYTAHPQLTDMDGEISRLSIECTRARMDGNTGLEKDIREQIDAVKVQKHALLTSLNIGEDYLNPPYVCPDCQNTGYIGNTRCHCLTQASLDLLYSQSNLTKLMAKENFSTFSFDYYSDADPDPVTNLTPRAAIKNAYSKAVNFVKNFDTSSDNLLFFGNTGLGKTFLSNCIASELLSTGHSVIYFSASRLFDVLAKNAFGRGNDGEDDYKNILECDLLIIDDLGTEMTNSFTPSQFFVCLNDRLLSEKSTVISTNLGLNQIADIYSERIFSRLSDRFMIIPFFGQDIRIQKRIRGLQ